MNDIKTCYKLFGIECGEGWYSLIKPILNYIEDYNKDKTIESDKIEILQIKEKFGGLRIYVNFHTPELFEMIEKAESESYNVCELCGSREDMGQTMGWITSMCKKCVMKIAENGFYPKQWYSYNDKKKYWFYPDKIIEEDK